MVISTPKFVAKSRPANLAPVLEALHVSIVISVLDRGGSATDLMLMRNGQAAI